MKKAQRTLARRVMLRVGLTFLAALILFAVIFFLVTKFNIGTTFYNRMQNTGNIISGIVSDHVGTKIEKLNHAAKENEVRAFLSSEGKENDFTAIKSAKSYAPLQDTLNSLCEADSDFASVWVIPNDSGCLFANNQACLSTDDYGLTNRYWYRQLRVNPIKSGAYCSAAGNSMFAEDTTVVSIIVPVREEHEILGYLGAEMDISSLNRILSQYSLGSGGYPIITCNYGTIIFSPESDPSFSQKFSIKESPLLNILVQSSSLPSAINSVDISFGKSTYYYIDNLAVNGWSVVVLFDSEEMNGYIYNILWQEIAIVLCLLILLQIVINNIVKSEVRLVPDIDASITDLADGNFDTRIAIPDKNSEMAEIAGKLNTLAEILSNKTAEIENYANNDTLTGLPNRISLYNRIEALIKSYQPTDETPENAPEKRFAVMFIDVDNFKWLNETLGHNFGDAVLIKFSEVLKNAVGKLAEIYRFSGDEFIIILEFGENYDKIHTIIDMLQVAFERQIKVMTDKIYLKFSMGVSIYPDDDHTADMLLRDADMALHRAKESGKDRVSFYTNAAKKTSLSKAIIAQKITDALKNDELYLNFQPIISTETGDIHGFEELLRWNSADFGNIPPTEFIDIAEETGAIVQIGTWIFESSCRFIKELCDKYRDDIVISINVSPIQLKRANYLDHIKRVLDITHVNPKNLQVEITESTLIDFASTEHSIINEINNMGIAIALDDFGTGYSSLNYLKNFPIKCLKIDKSFIDEINNNKRDYAITDSIIDLVHNLGIKTIAEGIETVGQYNFLCDMKCDFIQGFLMSKPLDEQAAIEFVKLYDELHKPDKVNLEAHEKQLADEREERARLKAEQPINDKRTELLKDSIISK